MYPFLADIKALCAVNSELVSVAPRWMDLGMSLGLDPPTLDLIDADHPRDASRCLTEVLAKWLQQVRTAPSWRTLVLALMSPPISRSDLARSIAMNHGIRLHFYANTYTYTYCNHVLLAYFIQLQA